MRRFRELVQSNGVEPVVVGLAAAAGRHVGEMGAKELEKRLPRTRVGG